MTRDGRPIEQASLRNRRDFADPHIAYSLEFEEWQAAKAAGVDLWQWVNGAYPQWFRAKVIAHHQLSAQVEQHSQDAALSLQKRKQK